MVKMKRKGTDKHKKGPPKKPKVIKVPEGAGLRGCKKRKLRAHLQLRAEDPVMLKQLKFYANPNFKTVYNQPA
ncbi:hypothetical protein HaLaN_25192, partial [Haematococcus lacustris]